MFNNLLSSNVFWSIKDCISLLLFISKWSFKNLNLDTWQNSSKSCWIWGSLNLVKHLTWTNHASFLFVVNVIQDKFISLIYMNDKEIISKPVLNSKF